MSQVNDCKYNALSAVYGSGHINDLMLKFLQANGATSNNINDAWSEVFGGGVTPPPENAIAYYDFTQFSPTAAITDKIGGEVVTTSRAGNLNVIQSDGVTIEAFGFNQAGFDRGVGMLVEKDGTNYFTDNAVALWDGFNAFTSNSAIDPYGNNAQFFDLEDIRIFPTTSPVTAGEDYACGIWIIANQVADVKIRNLDAQDNTVTLSAEWQFFEFTGQPVATSTNALLIDGRFSQGVGAAGLEIAISGMQIQDGTELTSPISTGDVQLTRPATIATIPTNNWPVNDFVINTKFTILEDVVNLDPNGLNNQIFSSYTDANNFIRGFLTATFPTRVRLEVSIGGTLTRLDVNVPSPIVAGVNLDISFAKETDQITLTVNGISNDTAITGDIVWASYFRIGGRRELSNVVRSLWETITIQSPIPAPPSTSILQVESVVGGTDPKEVAYGNIGLPSDPQGSLVPPLLLDGEPFSLVTQLINPFGKLILLVNESQNWTVGRTVVASFDGVQYTFLPDVFGGGQDFNVTICQSQQLYDELYDKRDTDIDFSIISVTQAATPTLGTNATSNQFNDGLYAFYKAQGATGEQLNDLEKDFWCRVAQPQNAPLPWILSDNEGNVISDNSGTALRT